MKFVEFNLLFDAHGQVSKSPMLINIDRVTEVVETSHGVAIKIDGTPRHQLVVESFEEVKKRLGLAITPRAETLAKI